MVADFGSFLNDLLKRHGFKQQGLIEWLLHHQRAKRFRTQNAIKEHLRVLRQECVHASAYPLLYDIAKFFEVKGRPATAARIRHIYRQQTYDDRSYADFYTDAPLFHERIAWMVFPQLDRATTLEHRNSWLAHLRNGDRDVLRESIEFYYQYRHSYVHALTRQLISVDLAREAIANAEYTDAYIIACSYVVAWEKYLMSRSERKLYGGDLYRPLVEDLFNYLSALQIKATAASHIYYYAPVTASADLFKEALVKLRSQRRILQNHVAAFDGLLILWYGRYLRMLCRSAMSLAQSGKDVVDLHWVKNNIRKNLARLERLTVDRDQWLGGSYVDPFLILDTISRCRALLANNISELESAREIVKAIPTTISYHAPHQTSMTRFRVATTAAICDINAYRIIAAREGGQKSHDALLLAGKRVRHIADTVPAARQYHIRHTTRMLASYLQSMRIAAFEREVTTGGRLAMTSYVGDGTWTPFFVPADVEGVSVFEEVRRDSKTISAELEEYRLKGAAMSGVMFAVNADDPEHVETILQANALAHRPNIVELTPYDFS